MDMSIERAAGIIDRHLAPGPGAQSRGRSRYKTRTDFTGREDPPMATLPAFYVGWRDGPSPYDPHTGEYQVSIDKVWESRNDFVLCDHPYDAQPADKAAHVVAESADPQKQIDVYPNYFHTKVHAQGVRINGSDMNNTEGKDIGVEGAMHSSHVAGGGAVDDTTDIYVCNPTKDKLLLEEEMMARRSNKFVQNLRKDKNKLYTQCIRSHPHGILGIRESPYGDPGVVYADHQQRMLRTRMWDQRTLLGPVDTGDDHLRGSIALREDPLVRCKAGQPPEDNLFGGTFRKQ